MPGGRQSASGSAAIGQGWRAARRIGGHVTMHDHAGLGPAGWRARSTAERTRLEGPDRTLPNHPLFHWAKCRRLPLRPCVWVWACGDCAGMSGAGRGAGMRARIAMSRRRAQPGLLPRGYASAHGGCSPCRFPSGPQWVCCGRYSRSADDTPPRRRVSAAGHVPTPGARSGGGRYPGDPHSGSAGKGRVQRHRDILSPPPQLPHIVIVARERMP